VTLPNLPNHQAAYFDQHLTPPKFLLYFFPFSPLSFGCSTSTLCFSCEVTCRLARECASWLWTARVYSDKPKWPSPRQDHLSSGDGMEQHQPSIIQQVPVMHQRESFDFIQEHILHVTQPFILHCTANTVSGDTNCCSSQVARVYRGGSY
jgi:hypothetical protein